MADSTPEKQSLLNEVIRGLLKNIDLCFVDTSQTPETIVKKEFFGKLHAIILTEDPSACVYIRGGVVRSLLSYTYRKVHTYYQKDGATISDEQTSTYLQRIQHGQGRRGTKNNKITKSIKALGVGSDLDIAIQFSKDGGHNRQAILNKVRDFINSQEVFFGLRYDNSSIKHILFPKADVKDYADITKKSDRNPVSQGGSTLDWLCFDIHQNTFLLPDNYSNILSNWLQGIVNYVKPENSQPAEQKQTLRGLRPIFENGGTYFDKESEAIITEELESILKELQSGGHLDAAAEEQIIKLIRNSSYACSNNLISD